MPKYEQHPSYWMSEAPLPNFAPLSQNLKVQVAVVGGGISGLTAAYELSRRGVSVAILEDGLIGGGETSRTTAHLSNVLDDRYTALEQHLGKQNAHLAASSHAEAIDFIEKFCHAKQIDCGFERLPAYLFNPPGEKPDNLFKELEAAQRAGLKSAALLSDAPFKAFKTGPCLKFENQAQFLPMPYLHGLTKCIVEQGGVIACHTHVTDIREDVGILTTPHFSVEAEFIVVATNSPIHSRFFPHIKQASYRTYVIVGAVPSDCLPKALYYDTVDPYHYLRLFERAGKTFAMIGGEDRRVGEEGQDPQERYRALEKWTKERLPEFGPVTQQWSGQIIEPADGLAFIGRSQPKSHLFIMTGDSGNGLTHGTLGGKLVADLITGRDNPYAALYDPARKTVASLPQLVAENADTFWQYRDWLAPAEVDSAEDIAVNSGAIMRQGLRKVAVYKDCQGCVHKLSAICPHLQGLVRWNALEHTWDCPCHGSRFTAAGKVINGPANADLSPIEDETRV